MQATLRVYRYDTEGRSRALQCTSHGWKQYLRKEAACSIGSLAAHSSIGAQLLW